MVSLAEPRWLLALPFLWALLYWLHRRPGPRVRPATAVFLWKEAAARARRRRLDLDLVLLLAATTLAVLALTWPSLPRPGPRVVVLDASASMAAGRRWARAQQAASRLLKKAPRAVLVRAGLAPEVFGPAPGARLVPRLKKLAPGDQSADLAAAAALGLARLPGARVWVVSDAEGEVNVAAMEKNVGITALAPGLVALGNAGPGPWKGRVEVAGQAYEVRVPARSFVALEVPARRRFKARLQGEDALLLDDLAFYSERALRVAVEDPPPALARLLGLLGVRPAARAPLAIQFALPPALPERPTLYFAPEAGPPVPVVDREAADPFLYGVALLGMRLAAPPAPPAPWRPLARGPKGEGLIWKNGPSLYLPPLASLEDQPFFPVLAYNFFAPFRRAQAPLGTGGVLRPDPLHTLEAPFETLLPRPKAARSRQDAGRRALYPPLLLLAALFLALEALHSRYAGAPPKRSRPPRARAP